MRQRAAAYDLNIDNTDCVTNYRIVDLSTILLCCLQYVRGVGGIIAPHSIIRKPEFIPTTTGAGQAGRDSPGSSIRRIYKLMVCWITTSTGAIGSGRHYSRLD